MIIGRDHIRWIFGATAAALAASAAYLVYSVLSANGPRAGSAVGLTFAFAGTALIVFECLLGARKKYPASPIGRVSTWLRAHIWLGLLSFLLILFHAGFRWGQGLAFLLMWLFVIIVVSGVLGVVLQTVLPRYIMERVPRETLYEQIPHAVDELRREADERTEFVVADLGIGEGPPNWFGPAA